jgi:hypothetical protein
MNKLLKILFFTGISILILFEVANVYFIMPMPGSQNMRSIDLAYFLYTHRWVVRSGCGILILAGIAPAIKSDNKLYAAIPLLLLAVVIWLFNFKMNADSMFKQPETLILKGQKDNIVGENSLAICIQHNGQSKGYPVRFIQYHHQVRDTVGGLPVMITYCNVCRTGRVYLPVVNGHPEKFRLVGMDHYNAMFEDQTTKSWWRQSTGEAVTGPMKDAALEEAESMQLTVGKLFELDPEALVMQPDKSFISEYDTLGKFELGKSKSKLTRTDTLSWQNKSWILGITAGHSSKAYDWKKFKQDGIINDTIGRLPVVIILSGDGQSFSAFERPTDSLSFSSRNDTLLAGGEKYDISGKCLTSPGKQLKKIKTYQEFWHSWKYFHPETTQNK